MPRPLCGGRGFVFPGGAGVGRRNTRRMNQLRERFFAEGKRLDADPVTREQAVCWICSQRIDYDAAPGTTDDSHELDHRVPVSVDDRLQEDWSNFEHSHRGCNRERSNGAPTGGLGEPVAPWW